MAKKRNAQDSTLRNTRAAAKRDKSHAARLAKVETVLTMLAAGLALLSKSLATKPKAKAKRRRVKR
jgi:hypothetical protein